MNGPGSTPRGNNPFGRRSLIGLLVVGAIAFLAFLYSIGTGSPGSGATSGHAAANGLTGYSALVKLMRASDVESDLLRSEQTLRTSPGLVVLTPEVIEQEDLDDIVRERYYTGPTLIILPKYIIQPLPSQRRGWEKITGTLFVDASVAQLQGVGLADVRLFQSKDKKPGLMRSGWAGGARIKGPAEPRTIASGDLSILIRDDQSGQALLAYNNKREIWEEIEDFAGRPVSDEALEQSAGRGYPLLIASDADLFNNQGMADPVRAAQAVALIKMLHEGARAGDAPLLFDITLNGYAQSQNLLSLMLQPPFLAVTILLLLALFGLAFVALNRFGPPLASLRAYAFGKSALVANSADLALRLNRADHVGPLYADLVRDSAARAAGLARIRGTENQVEALERLPVAEGDMPYAELDRRMRNAEGRQAITAAAAALHGWKQTILKGNTRS